MPDEMSDLAKERLAALQGTLEEHSINVRTNAYTIYDSKADAYEWPFPARTHGKAIQFILSRAMNPDNPMHNFPADFVLFHCGYFDDNTAQYTGENLKTLGTVHQLMTQYSQQENE